LSVNKGSEVGMIMIYIDMHMPDNCDECRFNTEYGFCKAMPDNFCGNTDDRKRPEWCPLKEQEALPVYEDKNNKCECGEIVCRYWHPKFCGFCGRELLWY